MNKVLNGAVLPFAFAAVAAVAQEPPENLELLPANICLIHHGVATIYYQIEDEGIFAPGIRSAATLTDKPGVLSWAAPVAFSAAKPGTYTAAAQEFNRKTNLWTTPAKGEITVTVKAWEHGGAQGACSGKGSYSLSAAIIRGEDYSPIHPGGEILVHRLVDKSRLPASLRGVALRR